MKLEDEASVNSVATSDPRVRIVAKSRSEIDRRCPAVTREERALGGQVAGDQGSFPELSTWYHRVVVHS
jgi:hypothetical protein